MPADPRLLTSDELRRFQETVCVLPDSRLPDKAALLLMGHGVLPPNVCLAARRAFIPPDRDLPGQVTVPHRGAEETVILSDPAALSIRWLLSTHHSSLILPGATARQLKRLLADHLAEAALEPVSAGALRASVRRPREAGGAASC